MRKILILVLAVVAGWSVAAPSFSQSIGAGQTAPAIVLPQFGGGTLNTADYSGKILFLNFLGSY